MSRGDRRVRSENGIASGTIQWLVTGELGYDEAGRSACEPDMIVSLLAELIVGDLGNVGQNLFVSRWNDIEIPGHPPLGSMVPTCQSHPYISCGYSP